MPDRPILIAYDGSDYAKAAIEQAAEQLKSGRRAIVLTAGVVVLGSQGRTGIERVLIGSVAGAVASHTERPVLIAHDRPVSTS